MVFVYFNKVDMIIIP